MVPQPLRTLPRLGTLSISTSIAWPDLGGLEDLPALHTFGFTGNILALQEIPRLPHVRHATIKGSSYYSIPLRRLADLPDMPQLRTLTLDKADSLPGTGRHPLLLNLHLTGPFSDLSPLASLTELTHLHLSGEDFEDLTPVSRIPSLRLLIRKPHVPGEKRLPAPLPPGVLPRDNPRRHRNGQIRNPLVRPHPQPPPTQPPRQILDRRGNPLRLRPRLPLPQNHQALPHRPPPADRHRHPQNHRFLPPPLDRPHLRGQPRRVRARHRRNHRQRPRSLRRRKRTPGMGSLLPPQKRAGRLPTPEVPPPAKPGNRRPGPAPRHKAPAAPAAAPEETPYDKNRDLTFDLGTSLSLCGTVSETAFYVHEQERPLAETLLETTAEPGLWQDEAF